MASTIDLRSEDAVIDSCGEGVVTSFLKGLPLSSFLPNLNKSHGKIPAAKRKVSSSEVIESAIATGIASAHLAKSAESIAVAFLSYSPGVSAAARGALLFSITRKLPVIYVYTGKEALKSEILSSLGLPVIPVDGTDVVAVYRVMHECAVRARRGTGPSVIACDFSAKGTRRDPIRSMQNYLAAKGLFHKDQNRPDLRAFEKEIKQAFKAKDAISPSRAGNIFFV